MISPTKAVSDPVAGRQIGDPPLRVSPAPYSPARYRNMTTRGGGGPTQRHILSTCHPNGAPVAVKEDTAAEAKLLFVRLISKDLKVVVCLLVGEEEDQAQSSPPWMRPEVDMHAGKKATCLLR